MRIIWLVALAGAGLGIALGADPAEKLQKDLVVHEWGVISVYNDVELANADMRAVWAGLPKFVYGNVDRRSIPVQQAIVFAPVIYFHTPKDTNVHVKLEFPGGRPAVWWPANSNIPFDVKPCKVTCDKHLEWQLELTMPQQLPADEEARKRLLVEHPQQWRALRTSLKPLPKGHWMEACRAVAAAEVRSYDWEYGGEKEKFVYYDGLVPAPKAAELTVGQNVSLKNRARHAIFDVTVVDRRRPGRTFVARLATLGPGKEIESLDFKEIASDRGRQTPWRNWSAS
jgi:hypothetical protein